jgi:beta-lactamase family protein
MHLISTLLVVRGKSMDKRGKIVGTRLYLARPVSLFLGIVLWLPIVICAQTIHDRVLTVGKPADARMSEPVLKAAVSLYSEAVARGDILGAVLLVARHGKVVVYEAVGVRDREKNLPMEKDTPFQIQSMTKPLVASAALILADHGKLQLDDPVSRYIPAFAQGRSQGIKVHNLANHTSGFRIPTNFLAKTNAEIRDGSTLQGEVARLPEIGPAETPGSSFDYSNPGYKSSYLTDNGDHNGPHLMFFQREKNDATWGANVTNAPVVSVNY